MIWLILAFLSILYSHLIQLYILYFHLIKIGRIIRDYSLSSSVHRITLPVHSRSSGSFCAWSALTPRLKMTIACQIPFTTFKHLKTNALGKWQLKDPTHQNPSFANPCGVYWSKTPSNRLLWQLKRANGWANSPPQRPSQYFHQWAMRWISPL